MQTSLSIEEKLTKALNFIKRYPKLAIAFSGGVDSSVVAKLAKDALGKNAVAITINSPLLPRGELDRARKVAEEIGISHLIVDSNELEIPEFSANPPDRCYYCKRSRCRKLKERALQLGIRWLADGTNLSDFDERRPGVRAAIEEEILWPLVEARMTKDEVRRAATFLGLPTAEAPSSPCLATRIPYGDRITIERLRRIDEAERWLRESFRLHIVRVRDHRHIARIEVDWNDISALLKPNVAREVVRKLKQLGFTYVTLDLEGYRSGSFDELLAKITSSR